MTITDLTERQLALDPAQSFIIQAPAGSGKTELLIQRYLKLLSLVDKPENILAITFTRKAASEMRHRILAALEKAKNQPCPEAKHEQQTWLLAQAALARDREYNWRLLENSQRLSLQTIDAFCAALTQKLPLLSQLGGQVNMSEQPFELYQLAIRTLLTDLSKQQHDTDFTRLLLHLDNNWLQLEKMLAALLAKRDHWLRFLPYVAEPMLLKKKLEASLCQIHLEAYANLDTLLTTLNLKNELLALMTFASSNLTNDHEFSIWRHCIEFPTAEIIYCQHWQTIAELLLTDKQQWRKQINKNQGFPSDSKDKAEKLLFKAMKNRMLAFITLCAENANLLSALQTITNLPALSYRQDQWEIILSLFNLLPLAIQYLHEVFRKQNQVDFTEIALRALMALGNDDDPTDLALHLDYQIQHILIDEFQDTSLIQMTLLNKLTTSWQPGDQRTLFLVGDPMQSIYRFRNAEVSLFLQIRQVKQINHVVLNSLTLSSNFRCDQTVLNWINTQFNRIFATNEDLNIGAVCYTQAHAVRQYTHSNVTLKIDLASNQAEADYIINHLRHLQQQYPEENIAILVQARSQLTDLIPALRAAQISFQGIELTTLEKQPHIQDLFVLTRALLYHYDRIAWLAILRTPFCGITLTDLYLIADNPKQETIWQRLNNPTVNAQLSPDGQKRVQHLIECLQISLKIKARKPLAAWIKNTWQDLGGALCLNNVDEAHDCEIFFRLLRKLSKQYTILDIALLEKQLNTLFAEQSHVNSQLQIMTIHKAKGLEFDHVILPGLEKASLTPSNQLLLWSERQNQHLQTDLLLAPLKARHDEHDSIYQYLTLLEKARLAQEKRRLFYVAVTRAKKTLCLTAMHHLTENVKQDSFLSFLLPPISPKIESSATSLETISNTEEMKENMLKRLPLTVLQQLSKQQYYLPGHNPPSVYQWQPSNARRFGTIFHAILFQLIEAIQQEFAVEAFYQQYQQWLNQQMIKQANLWRGLLRQAYFMENEIEAALGKIQQGLQNIFQDEKGLWIIAPKPYYQNEYALSSLSQDEALNVVIDRFFIDETDTPWIIDYKTSQPETESLETFLTSEQQIYQTQIARYATIIEAHHGKKPCCILYFPFIPTWITYS